MSKPFDPTSHRENDAFAKGCLATFINQCRPQAKIRYLEERVETNEYGDLSMEMDDRTIYLEAEIKKAWKSGPFKYWDRGFVQFPARKLKSSYDRVDWFHMFSADGLCMLRVSREALRSSPVTEVDTNNYGPDDMVQVPLSGCEFFRREKASAPWTDWNGVSA